MAANKYIVGIDIGGTKISAALFKDDKILKSVKIKTPQKSRREFLNKLEVLISEVILELAGKKEISGIGCGVAGVLDLRKGIVLNAPNIKSLNGFNIKNWLHKKFGCEVKIDNDARSFTRAEYLFGAGRGYKNIVGMTLGTGIGGGIIMNGKMVYGISGSAGEVGHMIMQFKIKNQNSKFFTQDFEDLASTKIFRYLGFSASLQAYQLAKTGDKKALKDFKTLGRNLGIGLANLINILDPEAIVIGGGLSGAYKFFLPVAKKTMAKFIFSPGSRKNIKISIGELGENAGVIGAAALFIK